MSTTKTFSGMADDAKPSSRVLQPPGGGSNHIFGEPEQVQNKQPAKPYQKTSLFGSENQSEHPSRKRQLGPTGAAAAPFASDVSPVPEQRSAPRTSASANNPLAPPPEATQSPPTAKVSSGNPLLGESGSQPISQAAPAAPHTSTKVRQPPGGASSGPLW